MNFDTWKHRLVKEIEIAAEWRAEAVLAEPENPLIETSQRALFDLAGGLKALPDDHAGLRSLFHEEQELVNLGRETPDEAEGRYREAKEDLLRAIGFEHDPFTDLDQFLDVLRRHVDETIMEFRLA